MSFGSGSFGSYSLGGLNVSSSNISIALTGVQSLESVDTLRAAQTISAALTGVQSICLPGNIDKTISISLTGVSSVFSTGIEVVLQNITKNLTGVQSEGLAYSSTANQNTNTTLSGISGIVSPGSLSKNLSFELSGNQTTAYAGIVTKLQSYQLNGIQSVASVGSIATSQASSTALSSNSTIIYGGSVGTIGGEVRIALSGVNSVVTVGQLLATTLISGTTQEVMELEEFTVSWTIPFAPFSYTLSETISGVDLFVIGNTLYAAGRADVVFGREIEYLDIDLQLQTVSSFDKLPTEYHAITRYSSDPEKSKEYTVDVSYYDTVESKSKTMINKLVVNYNSSLSNQSLKTYVNLGVV